MKIGIIGNMNNNNLESMDTWPRHHRGLAQYQPLRSYNNNNMSLLSLERMIHLVYGAQQFCR
ncbi:hypothetical protein SynMVIR181_00213 [Synechococcus sp. MVIR-18-1]|nr:hypothetical protein SynMVIR181_00213 [Synechococcus sp. MVIR-18-1]